MAFGRRPQRFGAESAADAAEGIALIPVPAAVVVAQHEMSVGS
jgi:hypothetical protein